MAQPRTISRLFCRSSSSKIIYTPAELPTAFPSPMCTVTSWIIRKQIHCYITPHFNEIILFKDLFLPYFVVIFTVPRETLDFSFWHVKISLLIHFRYLLLTLLFQTAKMNCAELLQNISNFGICWPNDRAVSVTSDNIFVFVYKRYFFKTEIFSLNLRL